MYFDTDVKVNKAFDDSWFEKDLIIGYIRNNSVSTAVIMAKKGHPFIKQILDEYQTMILDVNNPNNNLMTSMLSSYFPKFTCSGNTEILGENEIIYDRHFFESPTFDRHKGYTTHYCNSSWHIHSSVIKQRLRPALRWLKFHCFLFNWLYVNYIKL